MAAAPAEQTVLRGIRITCPRCRQPRRGDLYLQGTLHVDDPRPFSPKRWVDHVPHVCGSGPV